MNLWQGEWLEDTAAAERFSLLPRLVQTALADDFSTQIVVAAADSLSLDLLQEGDSWIHLRSYLQGVGIGDDEAIGLLREVAEFLSRASLSAKLLRELGTVTPERIARHDFKSEVFEAWAPLGLLVHIAPANASAVGALSVVEGLLTGNFNLVKISGSDHLLTMHLLSELAGKDPTGKLAKRTIALRFSSSRSDWLRQICAHADGVAAWGGEEALAGVTRYVPAGCRLIEWGPKISFAYLTRDVWFDDQIVAALAHDICRLDQQACASPQVAYLETDSSADLEAFAARLAPVLDQVSRQYQLPERTLQEQAEITNVVTVTQLEEHLGLTKVYGTAAGPWRLLVDKRPALRASPLYRTLWIKPLPRQDLVATLRPMRRYLQTMGLGCSREDTAMLAKLGVTAGVLRIAQVGSMLASYSGEPHDGVYALPRYARRISAQLDRRFAHDAALDDLLAAPTEQLPPAGSILTKAGFQALPIAKVDAELFFKSGGSSGDPKLSVFTYADYHTQMRAAAEGLLAAGLDPARDRVMNLFFGGGLYGGFVSFFSVLEILEATQFPMAAHPEHRMVAEAIVQHRVDTLLGMPSYILQVFAAGADLLRSYRGIKKIFFGGEHLGARQRQYLCDEFGVTTIRSAIYGSVDAGPLGYQCEFSEGATHHVLTASQRLEIVAMDADRPAAPGEVGRLLFTSLHRRGQKLDRYEIGDLGRWVEGDCSCGRKTPRFALLGRFGDVFRIAACFLNYRKFLNVAADRYGYAGEMQIILENSSDRERLILRVEHPANQITLREALLAGYDDLREAVVRDGLLEFVVEAVQSPELIRTPGSGKLRGVIDRRTQGKKL